MTEKELSEKEEEKIKEYLGFGAPIPEEKHNTHSFLHRVATADDTTKVGNLTSEEVGIPKLSLRALKNISLIGREIVNNDVIGDFFNKEAEILTSTSLSKDARLLTLAVIQKRIIEDETRKTNYKENKGWFKKKGDQEIQQPTI